MHTQLSERALVNALSRPGIEDAVLRRETRMLEQCEPASQHDRRTLPGTELAGMVAAARGAR